MFTGQLGISVGSKGCASQNWQMLLSRGTATLRLATLIPKYTSDHDTRAGTKQFDPETPTLVELFLEDDYQTVAISNNTW